MVVCVFFCFSVVDSTQRKGDWSCVWREKRLEPKISKKFLDGRCKSQYFRTNPSLRCCPCYSWVPPAFPSATWAEFLGASLSDAGKEQNFRCKQSQQTRKKHCWPRSVLVLEYFWEENRIKPQEETSQPVFFSDGCNLIFFSPLTTCCTLNSELSPPSLGYLWERQCPLHPLSEPLVLWPWKVYGTWWFAGVC